MKQLLPFYLLIIVLYSTNIYSQSISKSSKLKSMETTTYHSNQVQYRTTTVQGLNIFYREAGNPKNPTIVLLHGFPSSSHMYRDLIQRLSAKFHLVAPDYPGFGWSSAPSPEEFTYSFDRIAEVMQAFLDTLGIKRYSLYMQDYGGPIGFRLITKHPEAVEALIVQNANVYEAGLGPDVQKVGELVQKGDVKGVDAVVDHMISLEGIKEMYLHGSAHPEKISPDAYHIDHYFIELLGRKEIQHILFKNYETNFPKYGEWQAYLKKYQPPVLVTWGKNDKIFPGAGGQAYKADVKEAEVHLLEGGHFMLEEYGEQVADLIDRFFQNKGVTKKYTHANRETIHAD